MLALVTCNQARDVDTDLSLLQLELPEARIVDWDDPRVDWSSFETIVIRSAWDYHERRDEFLAWARSASRVATLWNPLDVIEWNTDKRYLDELARQGIDVVPTTFLATKADVWEFAAGGGFDGDVIVKPSVGASARGVQRRVHERGPAAAHARTLIERGLTAMVQPYLAEIETLGERNLVYLGGRFSHAVERHVALPSADGVDADAPFGSETSVPAVATPAERALGDAVMGLVPNTAYARIDLIPAVAGPVVLEVELTEPSLFLHLDPAAPARAAAAFRNL